MRKKSKKLRMLETNRISVFTDDLEYCFFYDQCKCMRTDLHEILYGSNRKNSMIYGFILPLCRKHHEMFHTNHQLTKIWSAKCQGFWEDHYSTRDDWMDVFHRNYID